MPLKVHALYKLLPTLRAVASPLEETLTKPSVTEFIIWDTRTFYLKKITEYAVDPSKSNCMLYIDQLHIQSQSAILLETCYLEERLKETTTTGQLDLYGQVLF